MKYIYKGPNLQSSWTFRNKTYEYGKKVELTKDEVAIPAIADMIAEGKKPSFRHRLCPLKESEPEEDKPKGEGKKNKSKGKKK